MDLVATGHCGGTTGMIGKFNGAACGRRYMPGCVVDGLSISGGKHAMEGGVQHAAPEASPIPVALR